MEKIHSSKGLGLLATAALFIFMLVLASHAFADPATADGATGIRVNWGEPVANVIVALGGLASWLAGAAIGLLPGPARWGVKVTQFDQVIFSAINKFANDAADEIREKGWTGDLRNRALRDVAVTAINTGNKFVKEANTVGTLTDKIKARLQKYILEHYGAGAG